ncbi:MAG TPA: SPOR domain-containing protein [Bryobacteraceae bacterium]|jgi:cell division septation protein DedD
MRNNETGEYELVVGNRQLLSGFFIVVLLCAVAFAMGYVVGENSHSVKLAESAAGPSKAVDTRPEAAMPSTPEPKTGAPDSVRPASEAAPQETAKAADDPPQPTTRPARDADPEPPKRAPEPKVTRAVEAKVLAEPAPGQYWQVAATNNRDSAETLLQTLKEKGFPATLSPGPNNLTRVLVGPYSDTASLGRAKTELEANGFNHMVRK